MRKVAVAPVPLDHLEGLLGPERSARLAERSSNAREVLAGRTVWNINSTEAGGGVAEMLRRLIGYTLSAGIHSEWLVTEAGPAFFDVTKRIHNGLHGSPGDGGALGTGEQREYSDALGPNAEELVRHLGPGDVVILHDPQTAGLCDAAKSAGCEVIWRCHVGTDVHNSWSDRAWSFLQPHLAHADAFVFSREEYAPQWVDRKKLTVIAPSIDPFAVKNEMMEPAVAMAILGASGVVAPSGTGVEPVYTRTDGSTAEVERAAHLLAEKGPPSSTARLVVQISRWDKLKDMPGVMRGFLDGVAPRTGEDVHLLLVGPDVESVSDDPEGRQVLDECTALWTSLPADLRSRVSLVSLPVVDGEENAAIVNALQRHASVITQKSLQEGFGLTVSEALWKGRPVVASAVGGILDQINPEVEGLLIDDPRDLRAFADAIVRVLEEPALAERLGEAAALRVSNDFLPDRHLIQWADLVVTLAR